MVLLSNSATVVVYLNGSTIDQVRRSGSRYPHLGRIVCDASHSMVHPREEHPSRSTLSSRPGCFASDVRCHLKGVRAFSSRSLCHKSKHKAALVCVSHFRSHGLERECFSTQSEQSQRLRLPSHCSSKTGLFENFHFLQLLHDSHCSSLASERTIC